MISGYLLLDRAYDYERSKRFYRNNLLGLVLTTEIWIVIYNLFNVYFYGYNLDFEVLIRNMLFVKNTEMTHMWYMPVIIGLYMFIPFAANALQHTDGRILRKIIAFAFIWLFIIPEINMMLSQYFNIESCTLRLAIIFTLTLVISWVGVYILSRSKRIGRILFFMK